MLVNLREMLVMFDGSRLPYAENAARTKAVADR